MKTFIVLLLVIPLSIPIFIIGFIVGFMKPERSAYLNQIAWQASCLLNTVCGTMFNELLITSEGYQFGKKGESTSSAMGKNEEHATFTILGAFVCFTFDLLYPNHFLNNIENN